ncbi:hypothetical protein PSEUBRA_004884 [Kalmanozyma brasiliensis GHG001]|uniref:uncharacterized protein n=1 Tax=Kalmanozyma brasiliensis (strain GHG001) TaxID=1365824 RepID=UPI002868326E|nr:uncharacterized protein PSEUBRA_004884 [Kalmanozyma brasiliensis GHG001]KAF6767449.1 hypothetical protein PSEUBRA_004884 [Kalmanozyma brasiliensis GHG001]
MSQHKKRAAENLSPSPLLSHPGESKKVKCGNDTDDDDSNYEADGTRRYEHRYPHLITRHWCSPQCLLGLSCDLPMDPDCPNYALHCTLADCHDHSEHNHPHTFDEVKAGMQAKLRHGDIWQIMEPIIGCRGNLGQLFRILFPDLGYAFLAVGLDSESAIRLKRENDIYKHIWMTAANTHENGFPLIGSLVVDDQGERKRLNVQVPISFGVLEPLEENLDVKYPLISVEGQIDDRVCNTWLLLSHHHSDPTNPIATRTLQTKLWDAGASFVVSGNPKY